jgi:Thioesterase-like superfamily
MQAVYEAFGDLVETRASAGGPWDPSLQHGAAPAALVAWAVERIETPAPMRVARLTLDLLRPVPVAPLEIRSEVVRQGRKIQVASITLLSLGVAVVRAIVTKVRISEPSIPPELYKVALDVPAPEVSLELSGEQRIRSAFLEGVSARLATGTERRPGPAAMWFRANQPIIEGEPVSPLMRAAIAADFCNGVSSPLDAKQWTFINGDVTLSLARLPIGEWILVNAETWLGPDGGGVALARLGDETGYFGRAAQSLIIERR